MEIFLFWFAASIAIGVVASSRNRSAFGWFVLSLFISPLICAFLVLALPAQQSRNKTSFLHDVVHLDPDRPNAK
jgi:hypothetical protein